MHEVRDKAVTGSRAPARRTPSARPATVAQILAQQATIARICSGVAPRIRTAMIGTASSVTWSPKTEIVWPSHRLRKGARRTIGGRNAGTVDPLC